MKQKLVLIAAIWLIGAAPAGLQSLSLQERLTLPASTRVTIGRGMTTTLGALRARHAALMASRNRVRSVRISNFAVRAGANYGFTKIVGSPKTPPHLIPIKLATPAPPPATVQPAPTSGFALDYRQFCRSVSATVCLYYPAGAALNQDYRGNFATIDFLITDPNVCSQEGGYIGSQIGFLSYATPGCIFTYPAMQTVNFVPPSGGFTTTGWCDTAQGYFTSQSDPHGAVQVADAGARMNTGSTEQFCFIQVKLSH